MIFWQWMKLHFEWQLSVEIFIFNNFEILIASPLSLAHRYAVGQTVLMELIVVSRACNCDLYESVLTIQAWPSVMLSQSRFTRTLARSIASARNIRDDCVSGFSDNNDSSIVTHWSDSTFTMSVKYVHNVISYVALALGIPGNILSAIVWLRGHVVSKNSSSVYLAALAIVDLVCPLLSLILNEYRCYRGWFCISCWTMASISVILEPMFVLSFSVERLIPIRHPLQVCYMYTVGQNNGNHF